LNSAARLLLSFGGVAVAATCAGAQVPAAAQHDPCAGDPNCRQATAAELFAAADAAAEAGDLAGAETLLVALTEDPHPELRAEARFRLASVRERRGDLEGAVAALRALLAEQPEAHRARLELSRILALEGKDKEARAELRQVEAKVPADVARSVRRFSSALTNLKRRGAAIELVAGPDSNINRATSAQYIDTVIAPFRLDRDARGQSAMGVSAGGEAWSRDTVLGATLLTRAGLHADLFPGRGRFDDVQFSLSTGPEFETPFGRIRPAFLHERRWYGGDAYSSGAGGVFNWLAVSKEKDQLQFDGSVIRQLVRNNFALDGTRYAVFATYDHAFTPETSVRLTARGVVLDAAIEPESLWQAGGDLLIAHILPGATLFGQAGYTRTKARAPVPLFDRTRGDDRIDVTGGMIAKALTVGGFVPLVRLTYTRSRSTILLYDFKRARLDVGLTHEF